MTKRTTGEPMRYGGAGLNSPKPATKAELRKAHGTPARFAEACNRAADDLMITTAECEAGIAKYNAEYEAAPDE